MMSSMGKKDDKPLTEADVLDLLRQFLPDAEPYVKQQHSGGADSIGVGRNGVTYVFHAKSLELEEELPEDMDFAIELREAIRKSGISQCQLAKRAGVPQPAISNFMSGKDIKLQTFNRMALIMGFELKHFRSRMPKTMAAGTRAAKPNG